MRVPLRQAGGCRQVACSRALHRRPEFVDRKHQPEAGRAEPSLVERAQHRDLCAMPEADGARARSSPGAARELTSIAHRQQFGAARSMKMGTTASPCPYDAAPAIHSNRQVCDASRSYTMRRGLPNIARVVWLTLP